MDELDVGHGSRVKRAKSLKRGKPEERITDRVSLNFFILVASEIRTN